MMESHDQFDFWYAVNNSHVIVPPKRQLESFGTTTIRYHLVTEMMDAVNQTRIREGRVHAYKPQILLPSSFMDSNLEGFSEEQAVRYMAWLQRFEKNLTILKYGFKIRKEEIQTELVYRPIDEVLDRLRADVLQRDQPMESVIRGVEEPWEVCLIKLMVEMVERSITGNASDLQRDPNGYHAEIEKAFSEAARDRSKIDSLAALLKSRNLFEHYEDRFFSLVRVG
ncbi:MAG: hypothetical protein LR011_00670 [Verrucomicrobia bacterium]|nr:hypothetical protein [Verrucomicrobiota bacterium]